MSKPKPGPTGDYPHGKLNADDEGGLVIGCAPDHATRTVRIDFGKPVAWVAMPPEQAFAFGMLLAKHAQSILKRSPEQ